MRPLIIAFLMLASLVDLGQASVLKPGRRLLSDSVESNGDKDLFNPLAAAAYLDGLLFDPAAAQAKLSGDFVKKSKVLVAYVCYERAELIRSTLSYLLNSKDITSFDVLVSQDGGSDYVIDDEALETLNSLYIRHPLNLCVARHHYFVKRFAFDVMGYDALIVIEEDNTLHTQAVQVLNNMLNMSADDKEIGIVAITDMDNSLLIDRERYKNAVLRTDVEQGHLWAYGMHASRYHAVKQHLTDYYNVIKRDNYAARTVPPLSEAILKLYNEKGFPKGVPLSQDAFLLSALAKEGYRKRLTTLVRLFEPMGWAGQQFQETIFEGVYGKGMYEGILEGETYEVTNNKEEIEYLQKDCRARLDRIYMQYLGRNADEPSAESVVIRLLRGKMNAVELVRHMVNSAEHRRRMDEFVSNRVISE